MRVTLSIDSASADEATAFLFAFQRTRNLLSQEVGEPTARMAGIGWGITTPPLGRQHATLLMEDFSAWCNERDAAALAAIIDPPPAVSLVPDTCDCGHVEGGYPCEVGSAGEGCGS